MSSVSNVQLYLLAFELGSKFLKLRVGTNSPSQSLPGAAEYFGRAQGASKKQAQAEQCSLYPESLACKPDPQAACGIQGQHCSANALAQGRLLQKHHKQEVAQVQHFLSSLVFATCVLLQHITARALP